jgi:hypothetical protein
MERLSVRCGGFGERKSQSHKKFKNKKMRSQEFIKSESEIEQMLREDVRLRLSEAVEMGHWMELLREYKCSVPQRRGEADLVLREFERVMEMREGLEIKKYKIIANLL